MVVYPQISGGRQDFYVVCGYPPPPPPRRFLNPMVATAISLSPSMIYDNRRTWLSVYVRYPSNDVIPYGYVYQGPCAIPIYLGVGRIVGER